jgi:hypothetical protein
MEGDLKLCGLIRASVQNLFPIVHPESIQIKAQLRPIFESIRRLPRHHEYVFGDLIPPITEMLNRSGFERIEADGDFAVWRGPI